MPLFNPGLFIGEPVAGATAGAALSVDASGNLASGLSGGATTEVGFSSNITTTSASDVVLTGMTITPAAGTYMVWFSTWLTHSNGNATVTISVYSGGVQSATTIRTTIPFTGAVGGANNGNSISTNGQVTVNGSQAITIDWHTNTGTATAHNGTMDILRIS